MWVWGYHLSPSASILSPDIKVVQCDAVVPFASLLFWLSSVEWMSIGLQLDEPVSQLMFVRWWIGPVPIWSSVVFKKPSVVANTDILPLEGWNQVCMGAVYLPLMLEKEQRAYADGALVTISQESTFENQRIPMRKEPSSFIISLARILMNLLRPLIKHKVIVYS